MGQSGCDDLQDTLAHSHSNKINRTTEQVVVKLLKIPLRGVRKGIKDLLTSPENLTYSLSYLIYILGLKNIKMYVW